MSGSASGSYGRQKSWSYNESTPLSPAEVGRYFRALDKQTGGGNKRVQVGTNANGTPKYQTVYETGRLGDFAKQGSQAVDYQPMANAGQYFSTDLTYRPQSADLRYTPTEADLGYQPLTRDLTYRGVSDAQIQALGGLGASRGYEATRARRQAIDEIGADAGLTLAQRQRSTQLTDQDYADRLDAIRAESEGAITQAAMERAAQEQSGRAAQAGFDAGQYATELSARQADAEFRAAEAAREQAARGQQAEFDAGQAAQELAGRNATAAQQQALAGFLQTEQGRQYEAAVRNGNLNREDMLALAEIYFGGKGQKSAGGSQSRGWNISQSAGGGVAG